VTEPDVLLLDEPTNHPDIATRERIEAAFEGYQGRILLVSHDRYLLDRLSASTLVLEEGRTALYPGNYSYVREERAARDAN
jgi:ATP-binding cassette subfamily F protein 3